MIKISAVIITFNEERNIERCLESLQGVVDEIVVVDSFSTDKTQELCLQYATRFFSQKWLGYSGQKNFGNQQAQFEYILSMDADEALSEELQQEIKALKQDDLKGVYRLNRLTNYCGKWVKHSGWYPDSKIRLFPSKGSRWEGAFVHEELCFDTSFIEQTFSGDLLHYSYYDYKDHRERADKYSALTAQKMHFNGKKASSLKPYLSAFARFVSMYFVKTGFLDGYAGFKIAQISALSNIYKYKELIKLNTIIVPKRILISRVDSIGDVVLTLPLAGVIKEKYPEVKILFLGRTYTKPVIDCATHVDQFVNYDELMQQNEQTQINSLKELDLDVFLHVFPKKELTVLAKKAGVNYRIATPRKVYQLFKNNVRPNFSRRKSDLHEAQLNVKLLAPLGIYTVPTIEHLSNYYQFDIKHKPSVSVEMLLSDDKFNLILHPKSKGSAVEWGVPNFMRLIEVLDPLKYEIFISGTEEESKFFRDQIPDHLPNVHDISGKLTLSEFVGFINNADGLIAASTGPLHIAAAAGIHAIGLYSPRKPIHPGRWMPIGANSQYLVSCPKCEKCYKGQICNCIEEIQPTRLIEVLENCSKINAIK